MADTPGAPNGTTGKGGLKIIGAGFGRTGTLSLKVALEELGLGPCYHMVEVLEHPEHLKYWVAAARGESINWEDIFQEYQATMDWPGCVFYETLMHAYPDARVLLTVRDPERWYESASNTIMQQIGGRRTVGMIFFSVLLSIIRLFSPSLRHLRLMQGAIIARGTFGGKFLNKRHTITVFQQHIEAVKRQVPPEKLLVYEVKEGWEPLCSFLGVEVPRDKPFPHLNDRASFGTIDMQRIRRRPFGMRLLTLMRAWRRHSLSRSR